MALCLGWIGLVSATGGALQLLSAPPAVLYAFGLMAAPAIVSFGLVGEDAQGQRRRALLLVAWAAAGAGACGLTGGLSGPLTPWCLAPVAVAALTGRRRLMAEAAALSVMGAAVAALAQVARLEPSPPPEPLRFGLSVMALASLGVCLAAGLARAGRDEPAEGPNAWERLLAGQPHLILALDRAGAVVSAYGFAPLGVSEAALLKNGLPGVVAEDHRQDLRDAIEAARRGARPELLLTPAADPERSIAVSLRAEGADVFAVVRDATDERAREADLIEGKAQAEALNSGKSRFLANMSHELRTPLNTIMGFSDIMRARLFGELPGKYGEYADLIHESGQHLLDLINDLLDMSKIEAERFQLEVEELDARDPVSAALRLMRVQADSAGLSLRAALPADPLPVEADPRALKQIVLNLLSNALKFTPRGGQASLTLGRQGDTLELTVADSGVGIAPEDLKRLGRPYEQAGDAGQRARGTGLGLSLVRGLAELHGGEMIIESALGEGTSVLVRLPGVVLGGNGNGDGGHGGDDRPSAQVILFNPTR